MSPKISIPWPLALPPMGEKSAIRPFAGAAEVLDGVHWPREWWGWPAPPPWLATIPVVSDVPLSPLEPHPAASTKGPTRVAKIAGVEIWRLMGSPWLGVVRPSARQRCNTRATTSCADPKPNCKQNGGLAFAVSAPTGKTPPVGRRAGRPADVQQSCFVARAESNRRLPPGTNDRKTFP